MTQSGKRVVVTGFGGITALGHDWPTIEHALRNNVSGIARMHEWDRYTDLNTRLGGPVPKFDLPPQYTRKVTRTMGRVALLATRATEMAIDDAGLTGDPILAPVTVPPVLSTAGALASDGFFDLFATGGTHEGRLTPAELRLVAEWIDLGGQYFNNPFDAPLD